jgi:hypothetical protein
MPKALRDFMGMSFFFWSNEASGGGLEPIHIHVCIGPPAPNATKIWLRPDGKVELCHNNSNLQEKDLAQALDYIKGNYNSIIAAWYRHFGL